MIYIFFNKFFVSCNSLPSLFRDRLGLAPGGWGTPLYKPYRYVRPQEPQKVGFLHSFGLKTGIELPHFVLESGMVFEETKSVLVSIIK